MKDMTVKKTLREIGTNPLVRAIVTRMTNSAVDVVRNRMMVQMKVLPRYQALVILITVIVMTPPCIYITSSKQSNSPAREPGEMVKKHVQCTVNSPHGILVPNFKGRRIYKKRTHVVAASDKSILIVDGACDQSIGTYQWSN